MQIRPQFRFGLAQRWTRVRMGCRYVGQVDWEGIDVPGWRVHVYLDRKFFGKSYWKVHQKMDEPYLFLGRKHRVLFHDPLSALAIAQTYYPGDTNAVKAANFHILVDRICTGNPSLKTMFEGFEMIERKKRRKKERKRPYKDKALDKLVADLRKIEKIRRLLAYSRSR
jgi:hypothetical protein